MSNSEKQKIVVAITGASGSIYARRLLFYLQKIEGLEVGVVLSSNAETVWEHELGEKPNIPFKTWNKNDFHAPFASGSAKFRNMVIIPCSMGTLGRIASGTSDDLVTRAADVMLKERGKLICVVRDTPYNLIHLRNMVTIAEAGGIILPASPSFYSKPQNQDQIADTVVLRILDLLGWDMGGYRWGGE